MTLDYSKLVADWERVITTDGMEGTQVFVANPGAGDTSAVSLPAIGSTWSGSFPTLRCDRERLTYAGGHTGRARFEFHYSTGERSVDETTPASLTPRTLRTSVQWLQLYKEGQTTVGSDANQLPIYSRQPKVVLTMPRVYTSFATLMYDCLTYVGKVNSATFEGVNPEFWQCTGADCSEFTAASGATKWRATWSFEMVVNGGSLGWQSEWDPAAGVFHRFVKYGSANFNSIW